MLYRLLIHPISLLPFWVLNGLAGFFYFLLRYVTRYRYSVMESNLKRAFPDKDEVWRKDIISKNYRHLSRLFVEGIKNLSISRKSLLKRMTLQNPELFQSLFEQGKSIVLASSHFENWEYFITAQSLLLPHTAFGIGKKIQSGNLDAQINQRRERFEMHVVDNSNYRIELEKSMKEKPLAILTLSDQSPAPDNAYWHVFLGILTPFAFGPEYMAHRYDMAVVYLDIQSAEKGHYHAVGKLLFENVKGLKFGAITEAIIHEQEKQILRKPEAWLWTHKRWKLAPPVDVNAWMTQQKITFDNKFFSNSTD
ncbi:MAG: hypothetical protein GC180_05210 [Bacteroidetes bacterium]|nr:hypothetical protein [Bacteroidota bacterium]